MGMKRRKEEFYCDVGGGGCSKYFLTYFSYDPNCNPPEKRNVTIECPNCQHHHFRVLENGLVTRDRHNNRNGDVTVIPGLQSTLRDTPWHDDPTFRREQMKVYNGARI